MTTVKIASTEPDKLLDIEAADRANDDLGEARITMVDTSSNRSNFAPGDDVTIDWGNDIEWRGDVVGRPSTSDGTLTYRALGEALPQKHEQAYRVFYEQESSEVVKDLLTEKTEQLPETNIHTGSDTANWTSAAGIAEPYSGDRAGLYEYGTDLLVLGARAGRSSELRTTYSNVTTDAIEDGFFELKTRLIFPDVSGFWTLYIELKTPGGTSYRWSPELRGGGHTYVLPAEEAEAEDSGLSSGELRYRLVPNGTVGQLTCMGIDHASTIPFRVSSRSDAPTTNGVESTGRDITRRIDGSVGAAIQDIATEDAATWYVEDGDATYLPGGEDSTASKAITNGSTKVTAVDADRDYEDIRNAVTVQGADGIEVLVQDQASIDFYGPVPRSEPIADPSLQSEQEARDRGEGFLTDRAWNDAEVTFSVANLDYADVSAGDEMSVTWADEGLDGDYTVESVDSQSNGIVDVTILASTGRN